MTGPTTFFTPERVEMNQDDPHRLKLWQGSAMIEVKWPSEALARDIAHDFTQADRKSRVAALIRRGEA